MSSSLVAYSLARIRWPGRSLLFAIIIATLMVPAQVTLIPLFLVFKTLGWIGSLKPRKRSGGGHEVWCRLVRPGSLHRRSHEREQRSLLLHTCRADT